MVLVSQGWSVGTIT